MWNDIAYLGHVEVVENQCGDIYDTMVYSQLSSGCWIKTNTHS